ncbi:MAG TPA: hypothetical protein VF861_14805 [Telluria sp.]
MSKTSKTVFRAAALSALLMLASCGGIDHEDPPPATDPTPPAPAPAPEPTPPAPPAPTPPAPTPPAPTPPAESITLAASYTDLTDDGPIGEVAWPDGGGTGAPVAGVSCMGAIASHNHAHISIYRDGVRLALPQSIGIVSDCTYELHTHQRSGVVHVEPNVARPLTLGQFFALWGQPLSRSAVAGLAGPVRFYLIDDEVLARFDGNPAEIVFTPHKEIIIVTGDAPLVLPRYRWPSFL